MTDPVPATEPLYLVVGSGSIGRRHIANLRTLFPEGRVGCVAASGRPLQPEQCGADLVFADLRGAIGARPRFAVVASAAPFHVAQAAQLLQAGVPVLSEKPLADGLAAVREHEAILRAHAHRLDLAYNLRFLPSARRLRELLHAGHLGRLHSVLADVGQYLPSWRPAQDYRVGVSARRELGGGVLLELSHEIDYLQWFLGPFDSVFCRMRNTGSLQIDVEDAVDAMLLRDDGLVVQLHMDFLQHGPTRRCKFIGESGTLVWDAGADRLLLQEPGNVETVLHAPDTSERNDTYLAELRHFSRVVDAGEAPSTTLEEGMRTLALIEALRRSSDEARLVRVEDAGT